MFIRKVIFNYQGKINRFANAPPACKPTFQTAQQSNLVYFFLPAGFSFSY
nr:MAG TPA: hypothetical protein [Caudoviricetes sp.]